MGVGLIIAAVTIGATVATTLFAKGPRSTKGADMAPANLDAFRLTTAEEGTVIPRVFGTVRLPGNLLYYGNLSSEPEYEETTVGGKGGKKKKQKVLQGYHYRMDVWQGIGMGPLELVGVYQDDRLLTEQGGAISCAEQVWNNGTGAFYPAQAGPYASRLPGVSHIWLRQFYLGFNVSMMPTLHYVVRFCGDIPLEHAILSNGVNPAAIILQLLLDAGASWSSIDKPSFSAAASFWAQKGYGLNIVFSRQKPVRDHIMQVLGAVGGWLIERADGTLSLRAPDPDVAPSATLGEGDFLEGSFSFKRAAWDTTWNDLSGKFTDAAQDYSERAVTANNAASIQLLGLRRKKSVDLTAFTDRSAAQRRIEELRDVESYPAASFSFDVSRDYAHIEQGQILEITHPRFGLSDGSSDRRVPAGHRHPAVVGSGPLAGSLAARAAFRTAAKPGNRIRARGARAGGEGAAFRGRGAGGAFRHKRRLQPRWAAFGSVGAIRDPCRGVSGEYACRGRHAGAAVPAL